MLTVLLMDKGIAEVGITHEVDAKSSICQLVPTLINSKFNHTGEIRRRKD